MMVMVLLPALPPTLSMNRSIPSLYSLPQMLNGPVIDVIMPILTSSACTTDVQPTASASATAGAFQADDSIVSFRIIVSQSPGRSRLASLTGGPAAILRD